MQCTEESGQKQYGCVTLWVSVDYLKGVSSNPRVVIFTVEPQKKTLNQLQ